MNSSRSLFLLLTGLFLAFSINVAPALAATGDLVVVAGTGAKGNRGDGGPALDATFGNLSDTAVDAQGNLFVSDPFYHVVRRVDAATGIITRVAGTGMRGVGADGIPALDSALSVPRGLALDADGNLFIAETSAQRIRRVDAMTGIITTVYGEPGSNLLSSPVAVEVDRVDGSLLVLDYSGLVIIRVDLDTGQATRVAGTGLWGFFGDGGPATNASFYFPMDLSVDADGNVFVADTFNSRVRRIDHATGTIDTVLHLPNMRIESVAVDGDGNLFVSYVPFGVSNTVGRYSVSRLDTLGNLTNLLAFGNATDLSVGEDEAAQQLGEFTHLYLTGGLARMAYLIEGVAVPLPARLSANQPPVADAGPDRMEECLANLASPVTLDGSGSWDPDGDALTYIWNWGTGASGDVSPTAFLPLGMNLAELTVDDSVSGSSTDQALITVIDTVAPEVALGTGLVFEADHPEGVYFDLASSGLTSDVREACGLDRLSVSPGSPYPLGTTTVTVSAVDVAGNSGSAAMGITVRDTTPPELTVPDDLVDAPATGVLSQVDLGSATATDLFGPVTITNDAPKDGFPLGLTTVTWTATDANGNRASDTQNVMVSYLWGGFLRPLGVTPGHGLTYKAGRTIPVRFRLLFADGSPVPDAVARLEVTALYGAPLPVANHDDKGHGQEDPSLFRYDAGDGVYHLNFRTHRGMIGMYRLSVVLEDGVTHDVEITLR